MLKKEDRANVSANTSKRLRHENKYGHLRKKKSKFAINYGLEIQRQIIRNAHNYKHI